MNDNRPNIGTVRHELCIKDRRTVTVSGVKEMLGFDEQTVRVLTVGGELLIEGDELRVKVLDPERGQISVEGRVNGVYYPAEEEPRRRGFWSRLVK